MTGVGESCVHLMSRPELFAKLLFSLLMAPCCLSAQAFLSPKGEGAVSLSYQTLYIRNHVFSDGVPRDRGHILSHALVLDVDYSLTNGLALRVALPYIAARYSGPFPHQLPIDGGT